MPTRSPIRICVTGAAGQIAYSLLFNIANAGVFGADQNVFLQLLDIPPAETALKGVVMELEDCAFPLLQGVIATSDPKEAFKDADVAIFLGAMPRKEGMLRKDLLKANAGIFRAQGQALNEVAKKDVKCLVVGNPANTNCFLLSKYAPNIPIQNFSALTRLDQSRARSQIALRLNVPVDAVKRVVIWGNHSNTQYPDISNGYVIKDGQKSSVADAVKDSKYLQGDFIKTVQVRGAAVIAARKLSSAMSAAKGAADHVRDWWNGTLEGDWTSMAVSSDGSYDVPKGLIFSFPVTVKNGAWEIVKGLQIDDFSRQKLQETAKELAEERDEATAFLESQAS